MKKYTEKERKQRLALVRSFPESGLSRTEFCKRHRLPVSMFDYWRRAARIDAAEEAVEGRFVEVRIEDAPDKADQRPEMEVELPYGVKLRFFGVGRGGQG